MALVITCPHCGKMESYSPGSTRTHCTFCKQPLAGNAAVTQVRHRSDSSFQQNTALSATLRCGGWGAAIASGLTLVLAFLPVLTPLLLGLSAESQEARRLVVRVFGVFCIHLAVAASIGFAVGAVLGILSFATLHRRPRLLHGAQVGALAGAVSGPALVMLAWLSLWIQGLDGMAGQPAPVIAFGLWGACMFAAAIGAAVGMPVIVALFALRGQ